MKTRVYLREWFYNAGIIGFLRILNNAEDNFAEINENYIEFETEKLKNFDKYYFKFFKDKYNVAKKTEERINTSFKTIKAKLEEDPKDKKEEKEIQEKIKSTKKYIKLYIKTQMDKIKKFDTENYNIILENYNQIDKIKSKEELTELSNIQKNIINCLYKENINNKLTMNLFKSILSSNYFGQPSFLNVIKTALSYEEQQSLMYKDYLSNIIEINFIKDILEEKYQIKEIQKYIQTKKEDKLISKEIEKIYINIEKNINKGKSLEEIKQYIETQLSSCYMCENEKVLTTQYSEKHFAPLAISSENMKNFFWNQNAEFPMCDICRLILFCAPAGITSITKTIKEYEKGQYVYKEKEMLSFVNYDTTVENLLKSNNSFAIKSKIDKTISNPYSELILDIVEQDKQISNWQLQNIFVIEFEAEYGAYSRMEYFNIKRYIAEFLTKHANDSLNKIRDYRYKLQIIDYMLKNKDIDYIINDRLREEILNGNQYGYNSYLATKVRMNLNLLKKENFDVEEKIDKSNKKLYVLYNLGIEIHNELRKSGDENKLDGYIYKMLNSVKAGNKKEFMDIVIRIHISMGKDVSQIFLETMQDDGLDFSSIGHSFIAGLISNKYEKTENKEEI